MRMRARSVLVFGVIFGMVLGGGAALASHQFSDVPNSNPFHKEIDFIADRKITLGCGAGQYCPKDFVTREQMAAFMERVVRVATPVVLAETEFMLEGVNQKLCVTKPYVPDYPQQAVLSGGAYAVADLDAPDLLAGQVKFRLNGGVWSDVSDTVVLRDTAESQNMSIPLGGTLLLAPGGSYEFAANITTTGWTGSCQLTAVIYNRMPTSIGLP